MALNVVIRVLNRLMALVYATIQRNLEDSSMDVMAGIRMVKEFQAVLMSSNAVISIGPFKGLEAFLESVAWKEELRRDGKNNVATIHIVDKHSPTVRAV